jgi:alpha-amylase
MNKLSLLTAFSILSLLISSCGETASTNTKKDESMVGTESASTNPRNNFPDWAKNATIYEVNTRQYTPEGTFNAFSKHIPRIKELGIDILWFMPVCPISEKEKKGSLGSPYAVADYRTINPEFGTMEDFKNILDQAHSLGMYVIIDWVPNHSGWDNPWITEHPEYYTQKDGKIIDPIDPETGESWGWTDVADFNYDNKEFRKEMIANMEYWIKEVGVDGLRCDVAHNVPDDFWDEAAAVLYQYRPIFMLAESEVPHHTNSGDFLATYAWKFNTLMNEIAEGKKNASDIDTYLKNDRAEFQGGFHMYFTSNHDENTWQGTVFERLGGGHKAFAVLAATLDGMPLVYGGQEAPIKKRLEFFERDPINWNNYEYAGFYKTLLSLKHRNRALWNGEYGGKIIRIPTGKDADVYAFTREKEGDKVVVIINLSDKVQEIKLSSDDCTGTYTNVFANSTISIEKNTEFTLNAWDYLVLSNK